MKDFRNQIAGVLHIVPMRAPGVPCVPNPPRPFDHAEEDEGGGFRVPGEARPREHRRGAGVKPEVSAGIGFADVDGSIAGRAGEREVASPEEVSEEVAAVGIGRRRNGGRVHPATIKLRRVVSIWEGKLEKYT